MVRISNQTFKHFWTPISIRMNGYQKLKLHAKHKLKDFFHLWRRNVSLSVYLCHHLDMLIFHLIQRKINTVSFFFFKQNFWFHIIEYLFFRKNMSYTFRMRKSVQMYTVDVFEITYTSVTAYNATTQLKYYTNFFVVVNIDIGSFPTLNVIDNYYFIGIFNLHTDFHWEKLTQIAHCNKLFPSREKAKQMKMKCIQFRKRMHNAAS